MLRKKLSFQAGKNLRGGYTPKLVSYFVIMLQLFYICSKERSDKVILTKSAISFATLPTMPKHILNRKRD